MTSNKWQMVNSYVKGLVVCHLSFVINTVHAQKYTSHDIFSKMLFLLNFFYTFAFDNRRGL